MTVPVREDAKKTFLLSAVEPSGDALGAALYTELKTLLPNASFIGCGGALMQEAGFRSAFPTEPFAVMGFTDVARVLPLGVKRARELAASAKREEIDAAILIDGWAFSRILGKRLKKSAPAAKIFKYAAPQVWASRPQRVEFVKATFDGVLTLLPFEPKIFEDAGVPSTFVGNPTFQKAWSKRGDGDAFRACRRIGDRPILCLLPGSRRSEVRQLLGPFVETATRLCRNIPNLRVVMPLAPAVEPDVRQAAEDWSFPVQFIPPSEKYDAFAAADAALAASGTVSTELAINGAPTVVAYRVDPLTAFWARRVMITPYASILNNIADGPVIPEYLQEDCTPAQLVDALLPLLTDGSERARRRAQYKNPLEALALDGPPAAKAAAEQIVAWLNA